jgi:hypothetical protein
METFYRRYCDGQREQVWDEMMSLGGAVREEPYWTDAQAVAVETMKRACENVDRLILKLEALGYDFVGASKAGDQLPSPVGGTFTATERELRHQRPGTATSANIAEIETRLGTLPLSLRTWYEIVGAVFLCGDYPELCTFKGDSLGKSSSVFPDPMCFFPPDVEFPLSEFLKYRTRDAEGRYSFPIAPEPKIKSARSGSVFYAVKLPEPRADALLMNERHETTFVNYLRLSFEWGGFPGWEFYPKKRPQKLLEHLSDGLLAI